MISNIFFYTHNVNYIMEDNDIIPKIITKDVDVNYYENHFKNTKLIPYTSIIQNIYENFRPNIINKEINIEDIFSFDGKIENNHTIKNINNKPNFGLDKLLEYIYYYKSFSFFYNENKKEKKSLSFLIEKLKNQIGKDMKRLNIDINNMNIDRERISSETDESATDILYTHLIHAFTFKKNNNINLNIINKLSLLTSQNILNFITDILSSFIQNQFKQTPNINRPNINIKISINENDTKMNIIFKSRFIDFNTADIYGKLDFNIEFDIKNETFQFVSLLIDLNKNKSQKTTHDTNDENINPSNINAKTVGIPLTISSALVTTPFMLALLGGKKKKTKKIYIKKKRKSRKKKMKKTRKKKMKKQEKRKNCMLEL